MKNRFSGFRTPSFWRYSILRCAGFLLLCCWLWTGAQAQHVDVLGKGTAEVAVVADMTGSSPDHVSIRILDRREKDQLLQIARAICTRLRTTPQQLTFSSVNPEMVKDTGLGLEFDAPVVPRTAQGFLPIGPFIEAFASQVSHVRIVYVVRGPFKYLGYERYSRNDVEFTVDRPEQTPVGTPVPLAFYGVHAIIKSPTIAPIPDLPPTPARRPVSIFWLLMLIGIAGVVGAGVGLAIIWFLPRRPDSGRS